MIRMRVTARLISPLIKQGQMTFDALLMALKESEDIPVRQTNGLFHASSAILQEPTRGQVCFVGGLSAQHKLDPDLIKKKKDGKKLYKSIGLKRRRDFGNVIDYYPTFETPSVTWFCEGDPDEIIDLLRGVHFLGKKRAQGYGQVMESGWSVDEDDLDGIVGPAGEPLRPVPADMFTGDRSLPLVDAAWRPPYWNPGNRAACYVPVEVE